MVGVRTVSVVYPAGEDDKSMVVNTTSVFLQKGVRDLLEMVSVSVPTKACTFDRWRVAGHRSDIEIIADVFQEGPLPSFDAAWQDVVRLLAEQPAELFQSGNTILVFFMHGEVGQYFSIQTGSNLYVGTMQVASSRIRNGKTIIVRRR